MNKKVSVIVPAFNAEKYLDRSIKSILNQTYDNLEIIIIDDASKDNSKKIIQKYASLDSRIRPIYSEINKGVSRSRNMGLKTFTGDYVFFMDADDYIVKDAIEIMMKASNKYNADIVDSYHLIIYDNKNKTYYCTENKLPKEDLVMGNLQENIDILTKSTYITGKLIKSDLVKGLLFNEDLRRYEDLVYEHQLKLKLTNMVFIKDVIYYYYQVSDSLINTLGDKHVAYLDAAEEVMFLYKKEKKELKQRIEALLVTNAFLTGITKIVKNNYSHDTNTDILFDFFEKFDKIFSDWRNNKYINIFIRKELKKLIGNKEKISKLIKKTKKIDFIKIYFRYLSTFNKYKM